MRALQASERQGSELGAWWMVAVLFTLYLLSIVDRAILFFLVDPIKEGLNISDFQVSLIAGPAFAVMYIVFGLPFGWLVDRYSRRLLIFSGVLLWSLATVAGSFAQTFEQLIVARAFVGIGEASLVPAATSLIADAISRHRVTTALATFNLAGKLGTALSMAIAGFVLAYAAHADPIILGDLKVTQPWQHVLIYVGAPGFLLCLLVLTFREPPRNGHRENVARVKPSFMDMLRFLQRKWRLWSALLIGYCCILTASRAIMSWTPTYLMREHGLSASDFGPVLGGMLLLSSAAMIVIATSVDFLFRRGIRHVHLTFHIALVILAFPGAILMAITHNLWVSMVAYTLVLLASGPSVFLIGAIIAMLVPSHFRGQAAAIFFMCFTVIGDSVGGPLVGYLNDYVIKGDNGLGTSMVIVLMGGMIMGFAALVYAVPRLLSAIRELHEPVQQPDA